jgi:nucleoside-diphosphate-sugar epimerase
VGAIEKAIEFGAPGGVFNIGGGRSFSVREIAETMNDVFDNSGNLVFDTSKEEEKSIFFMDCSRAESQLNWKRQWTLRTGLEDMKRFYEQQAV